MGTIKGTSDSTVYEERLVNALRVVNLLASASVKVPIQSPSSLSLKVGRIVGVHVDGKTGSKSGKEAELINLNPAKDVISGSIILAALFRVFVSSTSDSAGNGECKAVIIDLSKSLNDAMVQMRILLSTVKKELLWADAALKLLSHW